MAVKYNYHNMPLSEYCRKNNLNYNTIRGRIDTLRRNNLNLSSEELVVKAIDEFKNPKCLYYYQGISLYEFCQQNPELEYHTVRKYLTNELKNNPDLTIDEVMDTYLQISHKGRNKYYYCGIPLTEYCSINGLSYVNITKFISRNKKENVLPDGSIDEYIEVIMDMYQPFELKYTFNGESLRQYCLKNNLKYQSIKTYIRRKLQINANSDINTLIKDAIKNVKDYGIIYYYQGIPLADYCIEHDMNYNTVRANCIKLKKNSKEPLQEIINYCVKNYQKAEVKYYYQGETLVSFCEKNNLKASTIIGAYQRKLKDNPKANKEVLLEEVVNYYLKNPPISVKYYFDEDKAVSLRQFCIENSYPYQAILKRINHFKNNCSDNSDYIFLAIKDYEKKLNVDLICNTIRSLNNPDDYSGNRYQAICRQLNISYAKVLELTKMDFTIKQAIKIIWYFGNGINSRNRLIITDDKIIDLFELIERIKTGSEADILKIKLFDLIGLYKADLYDTRTAILIKNKTKFTTIMNKIFTECQVARSQDSYQYIDNELKNFYIKIVDTSCLNNYQQFNTYDYLSIKGFLKANVKKWQNLFNHASILNNSDTNDYNLSNLINGLSIEDQDFILLKFKENYCDEELALYFNKTITEIQTMETTILKKFLQMEPGVKKVKTIP